MKIKIQLITQIFIIILLISGYFYELSSLYLCLAVHEAGHFIMIKLLKKKITLLEISPLGGILHLDGCQNDYNYKELVIYLGGPAASLFLFLVFKSVHAQEILINSAFYVFILNLLPIMPLDGAKIIMTFNQYLFPYRRVLKVIFALSIISCIALGAYFITNYNYVIILLFFLYLNLRNYLEVSYEYYEFLLYKYFHPEPKLKEKLTISGKNCYYLFYKGFNNVFFTDNNFITEQTALESYIRKK